MLRSTAFCVLFVPQTKNRDNFAYQSLGSPVNFYAAPRIIKKNNKLENNLSQTVPSQRTVAVRLVGLEVSHG